jgi:hypothetical protein
VFVPRTSSTLVATWFWQTEGRSAEHVILGVRPSEFILLEFQSLSRRIFIGSHSLPPLWSPNRSFMTKRYITFGDNGRGRVLSEGEIRVSDKITHRHVALVQSLGYNFLSVSQLLDEGFEVLFWPGGSRILDSRRDLVCMVVPEGQVFRADFSQSSGVELCFLAGSSSELWK